MHFCDNCKHCDYWYDSFESYCELTDAQIDEEVREYAEIINLLDDVRNCPFFTPK